MTRFHVHIAVGDIVDSIRFYSQLFGQQPSKIRQDYAKWMLENPPLNFAISARGHAPGVNHLGFQVDSADELAELRMLAEEAQPQAVLSQQDATCCYSKSDKHWTIDPQGLAWEHFITMEDALEFGSDTASQSGACCVPVRASQQDVAPAKTTCCIPHNVDSGAGECCG